ncbi:MAG: hypothetical protein ABW168_14965 [Sedimenticola sp.]
MKKQRYSLIGLALCGLLVAMPAAAQRSPDGGYRSHRGGGDAAPGLDGAVSRLRRETGGRVLSAETREQEEGRVHHIRILTREGKVRRFRVDGGSGRLLPPRGKR